MTDCTKRKTCNKIVGNPYEWQNPCPCRDYEQEMDKYRWHDLRKNPDDLPELYMRKDLWFGGNLYSVGDFCGDYWNADLYRGLSKNEYKIPVIAWRETKPFEEEYKEPKTDFSNIDVNTLAMARVNGFYEEE